MVKYLKFKLIAMHSLINPVVMWRELHTVRVTTSRRKENVSLPQPFLTLHHHPQMVTWQRKAQACGLHLFPVPSDPFALPYSCNSDPLRGPILVPLSVSCLALPGHEPFAQFPADSWGRRMHLFQVRWRYQKVHSINGILPVPFWNCTSALTLPA